jgi:tRNA-modifying protein YgfZ
VGTTALQAATRPRSYVGVVGPDAADYLQRMVSNDVEALGPGESCEALLLTAKARIIAPITVLRRSADDYLLLTEPSLGEVVARELTRFRFAARCTIEPEEHTSTVVVGDAGPDGSIPVADYGVPAYELVDRDGQGADAIEPDELERLRILARTPAWGRELDDRVLPAEAGLEERSISFTKGCYPGQEPVARLHYRGHPNRGLRVLTIDGDELPPYDTELADRTGKAVGRVTSAVGDGEGGVLALAYVRREVPVDAELSVGPRTARQLHSPSPRP